MIDPRLRTRFGWEKLSLGDGFLASYQTPAGLKVDGLPYLYVDWPPFLPKKALKTVVFAQIRNLFTAYFPTSAALVDQVASIVPARKTQNS